MAKPLHHQIIACALKIIADKARWTGGAMARDGQGKSCRVEASEAVRFCAVGALTRAAFELLGEVPNIALIDEAENCVLAASHFGHLGLPHVNDRIGREAVVRIFERALAH
jgi:hypothetical protein